MTATNSSSSVRVARADEICPGSENLDADARAKAVGQAVSPKHTPRRKAESLYNEAGRRRSSDCGDILGDVFQDAPLYIRQDPDVVEWEPTDHAGRRVTRYSADEGRAVPCTYLAGPGAKIRNGGDVIIDREPISRVFVDMDSALERVPDVLGWPKDAFDASEMQRFIDRRHDPIPAVVKASERIMDMIDEEIDLVSLSSTIEPSPVGGSPRVGAYLAGDPSSMNRLTDVLGDDGPVRIFVDMSTISFTDSEVQEGRGVALLALAQVMQRLRPVELWVTTQGTARMSKQDPAMSDFRGRPLMHTIFAMRADIAPFDIGKASRALGDTWLSHGFAYGAEMRLAGNARSTRSGLGGSDIPFSVTCGAIPGHDIAIGPMRAHEMIGQKVSAIDWVRKELALWLTAKGHVTAGHDIAAGITAGAEDFEKTLAKAAHAGE